MIAEGELKTTVESHDRGTEFSSKVSVKGYQHKSSSTLVINLI